MRRFSPMHYIDRGHSHRAVRNTLKNVPCAENNVSIGLQICAAHEIRAHFGSIAVGMVLRWPEIASKLKLPMSLLSAFTITTKAPRLLTKGYLKPERTIYAKKPFMPLHFIGILWNNTPLQAFVWHEMIWSPGAGTLICGFVNHNGFFLASISNLFVCLFGWFGFYRDGIAIAWMYYNFIWMVNWLPLSSNCI